MKTVYIVDNGGCYSDYAIEAVFLDKEEAREYVKIVRGPEEDADSYIEEWAIGRPDDLKPERYGWIVSGYTSADAPWVNWGVMDTKEAEYTTGEAEYTSRYKDRPWFIMTQNKDKERAIRRWQQIRRELLTTGTSQTIKART